MTGILTEQERFAFIDVETANSDTTSICQIGVVVFENNVEVSSWSTLVDPLSHFSSSNIRIHGIAADDVIGQPSFAELYDDLRGQLENQIVFSHTLFDQRSITGAADQVGLSLFDHRWFDSTRVIRQTWPRYSKRGYGLANLTKEFQIEFAHHDALEDARAAALILVRAFEESDAGLHDWLERLETKSQSKRATRVAKLEGSSTGLLAGEVVVITGEPIAGKKIASEAINSLGAAVYPSVTKQTSILLVCGDSVAQKTGKQKKAEQYIGQGQRIEIMSEEEFIILLRSANG